MNMNKTTIKKISLKDTDGDAEYWATATEQQRLEAAEFLRKQYIELNHLPDKMDRTVVHFKNLKDNA